MGGKPARFGSRTRLIENSELFIWFNKRRLGEGFSGCSMRSPACATRPNIQPKMSCCEEAAFTCNQKWFGRRTVQVWRVVQVARLAMYLNSMQGPDYRRTNLATACPVLSATYWYHLLGSNYRTVQPLRKITNYSKRTSIAKLRANN